METLKLELAKLEGFVLGVRSFASYGLFVTLASFVSVALSEYAAALLFGSSVTIAGIFSEGLSLAITLLGISAAIRADQGQSVRRLASRLLEGSVYTWIGVLVLNCAES